MKAVRFVKFCLKVSALSCLLIQSSFAQDETIQDLQQDISALRDSAQTSDAFSLEQEQFDKMRAKLLEAEKAILEQSNLDTEAVSPTQEAFESTENTNEEYTEEDYSVVEAEINKKVLDDTSRELETLKAKYEESLAELSRTKSELQKLRDEKVRSQTNLTSSKQEVERLKAQLVKAKNRLMVAETEVDRLASVEAPTKRQVRFSGKTAPAQAKASIKPAAQVSNDLSVVTIAVDKANLRTGPGVEHSVLMEAKKGTTLAVEQRHKDWYRVTTPTGKRAWISSDVVYFNSDNPNTQTSSTVRVRGYDPEAEEKAFKLIKDRR
ncbi:MAG: SH3 domain-containing protein [Deltaproteobacteria bacterium]|nr:SH3 domain-containing protein [Deltaproteobacteria bacterium]